MKKFTWLVALFLLASVGNAEGLVGKVCAGDAKYTTIITFAADGTLFVNDAGEKIMSNYKIVGRVNTGRVDLLISDDGDDWKQATAKVRESTVIEFDLDGEKATESNCKNWKK